MEILRQEKSLLMSLFRQDEQVSTLRHFSQCQVMFAQLERLCQEVIFLLNRAALKNNREIDLANELKKTGLLLWDNLLCRNIKERLKESPPASLILFLDEELIHVPWEFLFDGENFLSLKFSLGRLIRTSGQINPPKYRDTSSMVKMLILANPTNDLDSAYSEGHFIKTQFDRKRNFVKIDFKSTQIETIYVKKNLRDYDIVHYAGHCEYDHHDVAKSGWVLSDGRFTTQDILSLSESLSLPSLVFSNACHSAQTPQDIAQKDYQQKTYSLAAAFLFSGVRHYIGAAWKVEDNVSQRFAREFYEQLFNGRSVAECMRLARLELVKEYGVSSVSWGSYLLYGDPNFVFFRKNPPALPLKARKGIFLKAGPLFRRAVFLSVLAVSVYMLAHLPSIDPGTYVLFSKSRALFLKGDNDKSLELSRRIIERDPMFLPAYQLLADTFRRTGQRQNALKYYFAYLMHAGKKGDQKAMASAYNGIAWTYHLSGEYDRAFEFYQQAISLSRKNRDPLNEAAAMEKLAVWYIDRGEYDQALELLTKSSEINRERIRIAEHRYNLACDYFDMGLIFVNKEDFSAAKSFYKKSQALFERMNLAHELSDCYFNLGEIYLYEKEYQQAMENYQRGLAIDRAQGNLLNFAGDYCMIGELYEEMGDLQKAEEYYEQGLQAAKKIESLPEMAWSYHDLGRLSKKQKKFSQAREYLRLAQALYLQMKLPDYELIRKELAGLYN